MKQSVSWNDLPIVCPKPIPPLAKKLAIGGIDTNYLGKVKGTPYINSLAIEVVDIGEILNVIPYILVKGRFISGEAATPVLGVCYAMEACCSGSPERHTLDTRGLHTAAGNSPSPGHTDRSVHKKLQRRSHVDSVLLNETLMIANIAFRQQHIDDVTSHCMDIFVTPQFVVVRHDDLGS